MSDIEQQQQQILANLASISTEIEALKDRRSQDKSKKIQEWALVVIGGLGILFTMQETFKASIKEVSDLQSQFMNRRLDSVEKKIDELSEDIRQTQENTQAIQFLRDRQDEWIKRMEH